MEGVVTQRGVVRLLAILVIALVTTVLAEKIINTPPDTLIQFEMECGSKGMGQVFWKTEDRGFNEKESVKFKFDEFTRFYAVTLPKELREIESIRFDPGASDKTRLIIHSITFKEQTGEGQKINKIPQLLSLLTPLQKSVKLEQGNAKNGILIIPLAEDPQLLIDLSQVKAESIVNSRKILVFIVILLAVTAIALTGRITAYLKNCYQKIGFLRFLEIILSSIVIFWGFRYLSAWIITMSSSSLWTDEIYTIEHFSSKGFLTSLRDYHAANNHILFNAINSLIPVGDLYNPLRARIVSFVVVVAASSYGVFFFFRRKWYLGGALLILAITNSWSHLVLMLEARGYGILAACGIFLTCSTYSYLTTDKKLSLAGTVLAGAGGTLAVPTFGLFAIPLWGMTILLKRKVITIIAVLLGLLAIGSVYVPLIPTIMKINAGYTDKWGAEFGKFESVLEVLKAYLLPHASSVVLLLFISSLMAIIILPWGRIALFAEINKWKVVAGAILIYFFTCLFLKTPALRTAAFTVLPISILLISVLSCLLNHKKLQVLRIVLLVIVCVAGFKSFTQKQLILNKFYVPNENWKGSGEFIQHVFPSDTIVVYNNFRTRLLCKYLPDSYRTTDTLAEAQLIAGRQVVVDSHPWNDTRFDIKQYADTGLCYRFGQMRAEYQTVSFRVDPSSIKTDLITYPEPSCSTPVPEGQVEAFNMCTNYVDQQVIEIDLSREQDIYSFNIEAQGIRKSDVVSIEGSHEGVWKPLEKNLITIYPTDSRKWKQHPLFDCLISIALDGVSTERLRITFSPISKPGYRYIINSAWVQKTGNLKSI